MYETIIISYMYNYCSVFYSAYMYLHIHVATYMTGCIIILLIIIYTT